jgi:D-sedoheptulose 7-phosphate isomerase
VDQSADRLTLGSELEQARDVSLTCDVARLRVHAVRAAAGREFVARPRKVGRRPSRNRDACAGSQALPGARKADSLATTGDDNVRSFKIHGQSGVSEGLTEANRMNGAATFSERFLAEATLVIAGLDRDAIERAVEILAQTRTGGGRLFILGVGGSAGNASHAVNDFRKIVGIEAYTPTDNVSELTARTNDEGWATVFSEWLKVSRLSAADTVMVFSVGGGSIEKNVSPNLVLGLQHAKSVGSKIVAIVGRDGGFAATVADAAVIVPTVNPDHITPHTEAFQAVVWHLMVSHPALKHAQTKWESVSR